MPNTGGFSFSRVLRPRTPLSRLRRPGQIAESLAASFAFRSSSSRTAGTTLPRRLNLASWPLHGGTHRLSNSESAVPFPRAPHQLHALFDPSALSAFMSLKHT